MCRARKSEHAAREASAVFSRSSLLQLTSDRCRSVSVIPRDATSSSCLPLREHRAFLEVELIALALVADHRGQLIALRVELLGLLPRIGARGAAP
jgi:hypothetical protein